VWAQFVCHVCGNTRRVKPSKAKRLQTCSKSCANRRPKSFLLGNAHAMRENAGRAAMGYRARRITGYFGHDCERCGKPAELVHHRDGNPRNNDPANHERLCRRCHITHHREELLARRKKGA
jgi:hypothetical protein